MERLVKKIEIEHKKYEGGVLSGIYKIGMFKERPMTISGRQIPTWTSMVTTTPTGNCQLFTVSHFDYILNSGMPIKILKLIRQQCISKSILMVDVNQKYSKTIDKLLGKSNIMRRSRYKSTNGTPMMTILINTSKFKDMKDEDGNLKSEI